MKKQYLIFLSFLFILSATAVPATASSSLESHIHDDPVKVELLHDVESIQPGTPFWVAIRLNHADNWHSYWKHPGDAGLPTTVSWKLPEGFSAGPLHWPTPQRFSIDSVNSYGYDKELMLLTEITPASTTTDGAIEIGATLEWLACSDEACLPGMAELAFTLPMSDAPPHQHSQWAACIADAYRSIPQVDDETLISMIDSPAPLTASIPTTTSETEKASIAFFLLTAFIGGLILNMMPCVLPVISLKILSFAKMAGNDRATTIKHGLAFFFGIVLSFWALAGALLLLQAYGNAVGWGFQLQSPLFVAIMTAVILILSLSMFGLFEVGTGLASWAGTTESRTSGSFLSGILATAVATPCTGPFLGPAIGFAVAQPPITALLIFTSLGLGMASPYLLLSIFPQLLRFMPKPGNWMITFKEITGFVLLATVLWLLWVFNGQTSSLSLFCLLAGLLLLTLSCWIYGKWCSPIKKRRVRVAAMAAALLIFAGGGNMIIRAAGASTFAQADATTPSDQSHSSWEPFSRDRLDALISAGTPVFIDFTARWCLICQANHLVLDSAAVNKTFDAYGVVRMEADWTKYNPAITEELKRHDRNGVPLYLLYSGRDGDEPIILPQVLTPQIVIDQLKTLPPPQR